MVSVKINSVWHDAGSTITSYDVGFESIASTSAVCKLAGSVTSNTPAGSVTRGANAEYPSKLATKGLVCW